MKKKVSLGKKLFLGKTRVADLSKDQQAQANGGIVLTVRLCGPTYNLACPTWDPQSGCETRALPGRVCR
ncbi:MAG TPA: class I lanthipeptide [Chitinophaga sp.]|uniref:class I lanthipeptide n=1 Tax=Chitinophaga sp. TaxID=1869181 RepID=UPI002B6D36F3|nr:class I lanthipeptide [Chitinophaga sp.]HVI43537.1 class I lanthipeptide [Chitinophaga sp.]